MMMMMMIPSPRIITTNETTTSQEAITTSTCSSWKLYENPFYDSRNHHANTDHHPCQSNNNHIFHQPHLPAVSARKIVASFWDLTVFRPIMESELDTAHAQITELKAKLDYERKARKRAESMSKSLARQLAEERRARETIEKLCEELAREVSSDKEAIDRITRDMEEERKMLRLAQVLREERVQMKLTEAKILFEEKLQKLEESTSRRTQNDASRAEELQRNRGDDFIPKLETDSWSGRYNRGDYYQWISPRETTRVGVVPNENFGSSAAIQRRAGSEPENPHIRRGIKGFVEFPRVVRAIGSRSRVWGTTLECQKAQLRILLRQRSPIGSNAV